jgi:signal recognition particle subunit SRP54
MALFEGLADKLQKAFDRIRGKGKLTEDDVAEVAREVRIALLEADVNFKIVKDFVAKIKERAVGQEVMASLTPAQQVIKIVHEELVALMGGQNAKLAAADKPPTVIMMVGLQGAGKTTHTAKLAHLLKKQNKRVHLVAADIYRPAAIKQLQVMGEKVGVPVFSMGAGHSPVDIAKAGVEAAARGAADYVILDTAGRLHIDEELMGELQAIKAAVKPHEILLVVDAMTGQDAVQVAEHFHGKLGIDGVVLTKLDGDTRGGAALSVRAVTGRPIKFAGVGEKIDALEPFHPERMASRILGMGDVLTLIEKAQEQFDAKKAMELQQKIQKQEFDLEDFREQMRQMRKLGPLEQLLGMLPGFGQLKAQLGDKLKIDEKELTRVDAIIGSMTPKERRHPEIIDASRRKRIAAGSGTSVHEVNKLLKQFEDARKMMKQLTGMDKGMLKRMKRMMGARGGLPGMGGMPGLGGPGGMPGGELPGLPEGFPGMGGGFPGMPMRDPNAPKPERHHKDKKKKKRK